VEELTDLPKARFNDRPNLNMVVAAQLLALPLKPNEK
jgi:hypothetical protein